MLIAVMAHHMLSAQFAGIQNNQEQPLPTGFKPASTNTFLSQYPAINPETRQATLRVVAPYAQNVTLQLSGKHAMTKDDKGVQAHGIKNLVYHESPGTAHEWLTWRRALNEFTPRLFR